MPEKELKKSKNKVPEVEKNLLFFFFFLGPVGRLMCPRPRQA